MAHVNRISTDAARVTTASIEAAIERQAPTVSAPKKSGGGPRKISTSTTPLDIPDLAKKLLRVRGLALSGGGAKGSFQVGALRFLYEEKKIRPKVIVGTSVGAVNGVKLAEGEDSSSATDGHVAGFAGLLDQWLNIESEADMFIERKVFKQVKGIAANAETIAENLKDSMIATWVGVAFGIPPVAIGGAGGLTVGLSDLADLVKLIEQFLYCDGFVTLSPVIDKLKNPQLLDRELVENSGIHFRAVWVGMLSGKLYGTSGRRNLVELNAPKDKIGTVNSLLTSVHASAAQPLFMQSPIVEGEIGDVPFAEKGFDGGVREIVGIRCALDLGANEVFAILCSPLDPGLETIFEQKTTEDIKVGSVVLMPKGTPFFAARQKRYKSLLALAERGLGLALDGVLDGDLAAAPGDAIVHVIRPYVDVHDGFTLKPSLIRVNMDHGWMCAFDVFHEDAKNKVSLLAGTNRLITEYRAKKSQAKLAIKAMEKLRPVLGKFVDQIQDVFEQQISTCKARIASGIALRASFGNDTMPAGFETWAD